jgi:hypothetical protein
MVDRLTAEHACEVAKSGAVVTLDLRKPLGMVVNPNGQIASVKPGGQAESLGLEAGYQLLSVANSSDSGAGSAASIDNSSSSSNAGTDTASGTGDGVDFLSLESLKAAVAHAKANQQKELGVHYRDPKKVARAVSNLGALKANGAARAQDAARQAAKEADIRRRSAAAAAWQLQRDHELAREAAEFAAKERIRIAAETKARLAAEAEAKQANFKARVAAAKEAEELAQEAEANARAAADARAEHAAAQMVVHDQEAKEARRQVYVLQKERARNLLAVQQEGEKHGLKVDIDPTALALANEPDDQEEGIGGSRPGSRTGSRGKSRQRFKRQRFVVAATLAPAQDSRIFTFCFGLVSIHDSRFGGPSAGQAAATAAAALKKNSNTNNNGIGRSKKPAVSLKRELETMTCELRCLRAWAAACAEKDKQRAASIRNTSSGNSNNSNSSGATNATASSYASACSTGLPSVDLFRDIRLCLMQRFQRGDVTTWFRSLLLRAQPKPMINPAHEDGSYLVADPRLGWVVRLDTKSAPCGCDACQDFTLGFPASSRHFTLPDVTSSVTSPFDEGGEVQDAAEVTTGTL